MESVHKEHEKNWAHSKKASAVEATQNIIDQFKRARDQISSDPTSAQTTLAKLQTPVKASFDDMTASLKTTRGGQNNYQKALDKLFKDKSLPISEADVLSHHTPLVNRAVYLHLLREGLFEVASLLHQEASERFAIQCSLGVEDEKQKSTRDPLGLDEGLPSNILEQFQSMHHILSELKSSKNLQPAIDWTRENCIALEARGSNLEFELCRLKYTTLLFEGYKDGTLSMESQMKALAYAQAEFQSFRTRYLIEIQQLIGAMAFSSNFDDSPYKSQIDNSDSWAEVAHSFTREFCSLLELSAESPLYIAATAGSIALPPLMKFQSLQKERKAEWTSANELPVETPLPPTYQFHSIFVCPVSKEQSTDQNPPVMINCGHILCLETVAKLGQRQNHPFKCPYCPVQSTPSEAKRVFV